MPTNVEPLAHSALFHALDSGLMELRKINGSLPDPSQLTRRTVRNVADSVAYCLALPDLVDRLCETISQGAELGEVENPAETGATLRLFFESFGDLFDTLRRVTEEMSAKGIPVEGAEELVEAHRQIEESRQRLLEAHPHLDAPPPPSGLSYQQVRSATERNPPPPEWFAEDANLVG